MEMPVHQGESQVVDLATAVSPPADGIISRTMYQDDRLKAVLFGFGMGQELSEHTASKPAVMHFLSGEADVTLDNKPLAATPGLGSIWPPGCLIVSSPRRQPSCCCC